MKESTKKALLELAKALCSALLGFLAALLTASCGSTTKATVKNPNSSAVTSITITTNNPSNIEVNPSIDSTKFNFNLKENESSLSNK